MTGSSTTRPLLSVRGLGVAYRVADALVPAAEDVSFEIGAGEVVAIVGESGSGKSTTAHAIIQLLSHNAVVTAGTIDFDGVDLAHLTRKEWREVRGRRIGFIPQDPATSLNPLSKVGDQVAEVLRIHGLASRRQAGEHAVRLLELAGIPDAAARARQYPHQFSGGMKQRALIAAALAADPRLVIADEPTSALDVTVQRQILDHLGRLTRELGTSVLLITHDLGVAGDRADRIIVMQKGRIVETGSAEQILGRPQHPYTQALIAAAPSLSSTRLRPVRTQPAITRARDAVDRADADPSPAGSAIPLLVAKDLRKEFALPRSSGRTARSLVAVDDVSFEIGRGETFALVGESGSGKSTTARIALRLETPSAGQLLFDGTDITQSRGEELRQHRRSFQLVYQSPYASLDPRFTVGDVVDEPLRAYRVGTAQTRAARVRELLEQVALPASYLSRKPQELSGGQRQRVAIARALSLEPQLVVLDEAVSALDVSVQAQILDLLAQLQLEYGVSYLFISHDLAVVRQISDRVGVMSKGRIVETGPTESILNDPQDDYTRELVAAIPGGARHPATSRVLS